MWVTLLFHCCDLGHTREKHAPANNGKEKDTGLGDELESPVQVEQTVDVLRSHFSRSDTVHREEDLKH